MNQAGLFIPAETGSILPIFNNIYADIVMSRVLKPASVPSPLI